MGLGEEEEVNRKEEKKKKKKREGKKRKKKRKAGKEIKIKRGFQMRKRNNQANTTSYIRDYGQRASKQKSGSKYTVYACFLQGLILKAREI